MLKPYRSIRQVFGLTIVLTAVTIAFAVTPIPVRQHPAVPSPMLTWQTAAELRVPESVLYDAEREVLYVSNINGKPTEKNNQGFISRLGLDGTILDREWISGLNAPKGMGIAGKTLYVSDIDRVVSIDISSGTIVHEFPVAEAVFLNDIAVSETGVVYVSDMAASNSVIYRIVDLAVERWLDVGIDQPNGLYADYDRLIVGSSGEGRLKAVDFKSKAVTVIAEIGGGIDGVESNGKGAWIISDWSGKISWVSPNGSVLTLLDTRDEKINAADIEYVVEQRLLLVPTFFDNRVMAYSMQ